MNNACYFSIAIDSYIAAAGIFIVIFVAITSAENIADNFTAVNGETVSVAVNILITAVYGFSVIIYIVVIICCTCCCYGRRVTERNYRYAILIPCTDYFVCFNYTIDGDVCI